MITELFDLASALRQGHAVTNVIGLVATFACLLFAGASVYVSVVEHPARLACPTEMAATEWVPSYKRATVLQTALALVSILTGFASWVLGHRFVWLLGAGLIGLVVPYSYLVVMPTKEKLLAANCDRSARTTHALLVQWGRLHSVRTVMSLVASLVYLYALTRP